MTTLCGPNSMQIDTFMHRSLIDSQYMFMNAASGQQDTATPVASVQQPSVAPGQQASGIYDQGARFDPNRPANIPVNNYTTMPL